jgi:hypothetical protein
VSWIKTKSTIDPVGMAAVGETRPDLNVRNGTKQVGPIDPVRTAAFRDLGFLKRHSASRRTEKACGPDAPTLASSSRNIRFAGDGGKKSPIAGESTI